MKNTKKGSTAVVVLLILVVLLAVGFGIYVYLQNGQTPQQVSNSQVATQNTQSVTTNNTEANKFVSSSTIQTGDWKTFSSNLGGGYQIKYPSSIILAHNLPLSPSANTGKKIVGQNPFIESIAVKPNNNLSDSTDNWRLEVWKNVENLTAKQMADNEGSVTPVSKVVSDISIDGVMGKKVVAKSLEHDPGVDSSETYTVIYLVKGAYKYVFFWINSITNGGVVTNYDPKLELIVSTFKFTSLTSLLLPPKN